MDIKAVFRSTCNVGGVGRGDIDAGSADVSRRDRRGGLEGRD